MTVQNVTVNASSPHGTLFKHPSKIVGLVYLLTEKYVQEKRTDIYICNRECNSISVHSFIYGCVKGYYSPIFLSFGKGSVGS